MTLQAGMHEPNTQARKHSPAPPQVQEPLVQPSAVPPHELPQLPQWLVSRVVLMQAPVQHESVPAHTRPQAPQFPTSLPLTLVQVPEQHR